MKFSVQRETLLKPLQQVIGAVERRQTMPMLGNVLLRADGSSVTLTATDLEVELVAGMDIELTVAGQATLPARKLLEICRALPEHVDLTVDVGDGRASVRAARSRFVLATLPAADFPALDDIHAERRVRIAQGELKGLIDCTAFAMAQQDVRYYLNGLLLHVCEGALRTVATDGHRMATCEQRADVPAEAAHQVIVPRKGVHELQRLLTDGDQEVQLELSNNHIRARLAQLCFTSKLIDGRFPDYERVLPKDGDKTVLVDREAFRQALIRVAILSSEKYRGVRLTLDGATIRIQSHNPDQEEAEEEVEAEYDGEALEIGFNVNYLVDALNVMESDIAELKLKDANSSVLMKSPASDRALYVVMPMRL